MMFSRITFLVALLAFLGLGDSFYLTAHFYFGVPLACGPFSGCETVTSSVYSTFLGIPVALFGAINYGILFLGTIIAREYHLEKLFKSIALYSVFGFFASAWFVYVMAFLLHAWCTYCLVSATLSTLIFLLSVFYLLHYKFSFASRNNP